MKTFKKIINSLEAYIKKNFFNMSKTEKNAEKMAETDEYVAAYKNITRWQTV